MLLVIEGLFKNYLLKQSWRYGFLYLNIGMGGKIIRVPLLKYRYGGKWVVMCILIYLG